MINRKQAADLLNDSYPRDTEAVLEAIYSGADEPTKKVLGEFQDLRERYHQAYEIQVRAAQEASDFHALVQKIQHALNPELHEAESLKQTGPVDMSLESRRV